MTACGRTIQAIVVAGDGIVGRSAALAFARALPRARITILRTATDSRSLVEKVPSTLPTVHRFHAAVGLDELELVTSGIAVHRLGSRFDCWSTSGGSWFHSFGEHGLKAGAVPFHSVWLRAWREGLAKPFEAYCMASMLAAAERFSHPAEDPASPMASFLYGLNLDPQRYHMRLDAALPELNRISGTIGDIERRQDGGIAALLLEDGRRIAAEMFIDCTGPDAGILSRIDDRFEDWSAWLPCDRIAVTAGPARDVQPFDTVRAEQAGWRQDVSLPYQSISLHLWAHRHLPDRADGAVLRSGRRPQAWVGNVLAIGDASVFLDPLHGAGLHLAHSAILRALDLMPGRDMHPVELNEYNRRTRLEHERVRDFLAVHYLRSGREDTAFWCEMARTAPPDSLSRTLEQFSRRGRLPMFDEESFAQDSWLAALFGLGVLPEAIDPVALGIDLDRAQEGMAALADRIAVLCERVPPYPQVLAQLSAQRSSAGGARRIPAMRSAGEAMGGSPFSARSK